VSGRILTEAVENSDIHTANRGYYQNSIAHKVNRRLQHLSAQRSAYRDHCSRINSNDLSPPLQTLGSNVFAAAGKRVTGVNFEMWMSPNQSNMDKRLHDFTSLQTARDLPRCDPSPLENIPNWRSSYPCLAATLDSKRDIPKFDIIIIETSYKMMSEFPPPKATLGLRLELDFGKKSQDEPFDWTCTTHIYQNGVLVKQASYRLEAKWAIVAPPFESMWWALTFIDKIEQKKQAEETGKHDVYNATQQKAQDFFSQLTAVHEIRARSQAGPGVPESKTERGLVAVLLWKFSIAPETYVGTTSWQRLLSPPARITAHSPPDQQDLSLPPFATDTIVAGQDYPTDMNDNKDLLSRQSNAQYQDYHPGLEDSNALLGHYDFELTFKDEDIANFASMQSSFMPSSQDEHESESFHALDHFDYDMQLHGLSTPSHHDTYHTASALSDHRPNLSRTHMYGLHQEFEHNVDDTTQRRPLANFDHNTHDMLQAQLAEREPDEKKQEDDDETLRAALAAASAMNDLGNPHVTLAHHPSSQPEPKLEHLPGLWEDVQLHRSPLYTHSSFKSNVSYTPHHEHEANVGSAVNFNAFDSNHIPVGFGGHEYDGPSASPPEIRRLLEMHNQSFGQEDHHRHQKDTLSETKEEFETGLGGSFVIVDASQIEQDGHE
jgi:hypothetical protein